MLFCIEEYEAIKNKTSKKFKTVKAFCEYNNFSRQNFLKIYHRWKQNPDMSSLVPQKRGSIFATRRVDLQIEDEVVSLRKLCLNRYDICRVLKNKDIQISSSTIYNIFSRNGLNKLERVKSANPNFSNSKKIIMSKSGELLHIDLHH
ncbi:MAG: hypothetical protein FWG85_02760, partial [Bacteroidetes bacterium]|nr:hypothetical protein [Bacteroidota bacterium]